MEPEARNVAEWHLPGLREYRGVAVSVITKEKDPIRLLIQLLAAMRWRAQRETRFRKRQDKRQDSGIRDVFSDRRHHAAEVVRLTDQVHKLLTMCNDPTAASAVLSALNLGALAQWAVVAPDASFVAIAEPYLYDWAGAVVPVSPLERKILLFTEPRDVDTRPGKIMPRRTIVSIQALLEACWGKKVRCGNVRQEEYNQVDKALSELSRNLKNWGVPVRLNREEDSIIRRVPGKRERVADGVRSWLESG